MKDASEDENEEDFIASNKPKSAQSQSKSEREEKLRQMMDDEGKRRTSDHPCKANRM